MKKALEMIIYYFLVLVTASIIGIFVYMQVVGSMNFVAGKFFDVPETLYIYAFFETAPIVLILLIPFLLVYKVRHLSNPKISAFTYVFLCLITFLVIFPGVEILRNDIYFDKIKSEKELLNRNGLSGGYFRKVNDKYYYFLKDSEKEDTEVAVILLEDSWHPENFGSEKKLSLEENQEYVFHSMPYKDTLVKENIEKMPLFAKNWIKYFKNYARKSWENGILSWVCFCSLGFAMACSYSLIRLSSWRLVNIIYILTSEAFIVLVNILFFSEKFNHLRFFLNQLFYGNDFLRFKFLQAHYIQAPLVCINIVFGILILSFGNIVTFVKSKQ